MKPFTTCLTAMAFLLCACRLPQPTPPPNPDASDAAAPPDNDDDYVDSARPRTATCQNAFKHFSSDLPCADAGSSNWADMCENDSKHGIDLHLACIVKAKTCGAVDACLAK